MSFGHIKSVERSGMKILEPTVYISKMVTENELVSRSVRLEQTLNDRQYSQFCDDKIAQSLDDQESTVWNFLKVSVINTANYCLMSSCKTEALVHCWLL